ncbi:ribosomal protein L24e-domain-containing protein [Pyronema omphalodes]|nr:ribosomal protein L24e-domain-containing protein [Pyronema omphalodes]
MRIYSCHFCSAPVYPSKGITFVRNDAKEFRFCRSKCHKNFKMKRNPRKLKWTKAFRKAAGKEMVVDTTLTFSARRHIPTRYSRDLVAKTLNAMQRVEEIRRRRERVFYRNRMSGNKERQKAADRKLVEENQHLLPPSQRTIPSGLQKDVVENDGMEVDEEMLSEEEEEKVAVKVPRKKQRTEQRMDVD